MNESNLIGDLMDRVLDWMMSDSLIVGLLKLTVVTVILMAALMMLLYLFIWVWTKLFYHPVREGRVVGKHHELPATWVQMMPILISTGKSFMTVFIPIWHYDDEDWVLDIEGLNDRGKLKRQYLFVSKAVWDSVEVGQFYKVSSDTELDDQDDTHDATDEEKASLGVCEGKPE